MKNRYNTQTVQLILEWMACGLLLLVITIIAGGCNWDTHDDPVMALLLFRYGSQSTPFSNHLYLSLFDILYNIWPRYNWWLLVSILEIILAWSVYFYIIERSIESRIEKYSLLILFTLATYYFTLQLINFTRTSCYISNAGIILFLFCINTSSERFKKAKMILGLMLYIIGTCIRLESALLIIPISCSVILFWSSVSLKRRIFQMIGICFIALSICGCCKVIDNASMTEEMLAWENSHSDKRKLNDYDFTLKDNADTAAIEAAGILISDLTFMGKNSGFKQVLDDNAMHILADNVRISITAETLYNEICLAMKFSSMIWFFMAGLIFIRGGLERPVLIIYLLMIIALEVFFMLLGRNPSRVFESILFTGTINAVLGCCQFSSPYARLPYKRNISRKLMLGFNVLLTVLLIARGNAKNFFDTDRCKYVHSLKEVDLDMIHNDPDHIYIMPAEAFVALSIPENIFINYDASYCDNMLYQDGFFCTLPCFNDMLKKYNVSNTVELMYRGGSDIYSAYSEDYISILESHGIILNVTDQTTIGKIKIVQYSQAEPSI